jgi:hypothetical protein
MLLQPSDKLLLAHRRLFVGDSPRYFVGEVVHYESGVVKVRGFTFVREPMSGEVLRKDDMRTKIAALTSPGYLAYELPRSTDIAALRFIVSEEHIVLTDDAGLIMNMAEVPSSGSI